MKKRIFYLVNIFFIFSLQVLALNFTNSKEIEKIFQENQVKGTFVLYNPQNNSFTGYNKERAEERFYPASTFKIYNSLIGLETEVIKNGDEVFYKYKC